MLNRMSDVKLSIIICTYNRESILSRSLQSLGKIIMPRDCNCELIIVDNNSKDNTKDIVSKFLNKPKFTTKYIYEGRQGKSFALNTGISASRGEILVFTDDDVEFDKNWLVEIMKTFEEYNCAAIGGKIIAVFDTNKPKWMITDTHFPFMSAIVNFDNGPSHCVLNRSPYGANMAFKRSVFNDYGLFRTDIGPNNSNLMKGEDSEFCSRVRNKGIEIIYCPNAVVYHPVEPERTKKQYFVSWYYNYGKYIVRTKIIPDNYNNIFNIPMWLVKECVIATFGWIICFNMNERFVKKLILSEVLGKMHESCFGGNS